MIIKTTNIKQYSILIMGTNVMCNSIKTTDWKQTGHIHT